MFVARTTWLKQTVQNGKSSFHQYRAGVSTGLCTSINTQIRTWGAPADNLDLWESMTETSNCQIKSWTLANIRSNCSFNTMSAGEHVADDSLTPFCLRVAESLDASALKPDEQQNLSYHRYPPTLVPTLVTHLPSSRSCPSGSHGWTLMRSCRSSVRTTHGHPSLKIMR